MMVSLITNTPLEETINIALDIILKSNPQLNISKEDVKTLFDYAMSRSHFLFDGNIHDQIEGAAMGSQLGSILVNLFMSFHKNPTGLKVISHLL